MTSLHMFSFKSHPVYCDARVHDLAGLEPQLVHHPLPVVIRRKIKRVFVKLTVNLYGAACNATRRVHDKPLPNDRMFRRSL